MGQLLAVPALRDLTPTAGVTFWLERHVSGLRVVSSLSPIFVRGLFLFLIAHNAVAFFVF
jgi:hypothetical protein